nr:hypothetical protein CFP56_21819 [Quercus suber]
MARSVGRHTRNALEVWKGVSQIVSGRSNARWSIASTSRGQIFSTNPPFCTYRRSCVDPESYVDLSKKQVRRLSIESPAHTDAHIRILVGCVNGGEEHHAPRLVAKPICPKPFCARSRTTSLAYRVLARGIFDHMRTSWNDIPSFTILLASASPTLSCMSIVRRSRNCVCIDRNTTAITPDLAPRRRLP